VKKITGLSKSSIRHGERSAGGRRSWILYSGKQHERQSVNAASQRAVIQGRRNFLVSTHRLTNTKLLTLELSQEDRDAVQAMDIDEGTLDVETAAIFDMVPLAMMVLISATKEASTRYIKTLPVVLQI